MTEVLKTELNLFEKNLFQLSQEKTNFLQIRPLTTIQDSNVVEFDLPALTEDYYDLQNVFLWVRGQATNQDGTNLANAQDGRYSIINYSLNTIWDQVDIILGNTTITQSSNTYPYRAWIELLTSYNKLSLDTHLRSAGYFGLSDRPDEVITDGSTFTRRSKEFTLFGRLHGDIFNSDKLLINGVPIRITLTKGRDAFNFIGAPLRAGVAAVGNTPAIPELAQPTPKLRLIDASIFIRKVKLAPNLLAAHAKAIQQSNVIIPIKRKVVTISNLPAGQSVFVIDNIYTSQLPSQFIVGLVRHDAHSGNYNYNPLAFKNFGLNYIAVNVNGEMIPGKPYQPDYATDVNLYEREYFEFFNNIGSTLSPNTPAISFSNYKECVNLYAFNFNADFDNPKENEYINLPKEGFLNLELHFENNLVTPLKLIFYGVFANTIEIDNNRDVLKDFN